MCVLRVHSLTFPRQGFHENDITETLSISEADWNFLVFVTDGKGKKQIYINGHLRKESTSAVYSGTGGNSMLGRYASFHRS